MQNPDKQHRAGFVNIIGRPNVGKSTLMNALVGEKLSIITSKAQTTRNRIHGIVNGDDFQIVYSDTPGILDPRYKLQESMLKYARSAFEDADVILFLTEVNEESPEKLPFIHKLVQQPVPVLVVMNKVDLCDSDKLNKLRELWNKLLPDAHFIGISALHTFNIENLLKEIMNRLPYGPPFYPKDSLTDKSERFFAGEIIREKILLNYKQEIPYSVEIEVEEFKETSTLIRIRAIIYVERETQKGIIIGHTGKSIKRTGTDARKDMEDFFAKKVFLELFVKVRKDWRNNDQSLRQFGYH